MNTVKLNILMLEDEENDYILIQEMLRTKFASAYQLDWASGYLQAEKMVAQTHYDLFLVDYQLNSPVSGVDWSNLMHQKLGVLCPPIVMLTGQPGVQSIEHLARQKAGVAYFLNKNEMSAEKLVRVIDSSLKNKRLVQDFKPLVTILMADDDLDDRLLVEDALAEIHLKNPLEFVGDGVELMDYLSRRGNYSHLAGTLLPGLILLDLNMPRKDGRVVLQEIKQDARLRKIPIVILTTSSAQEDLVSSYHLGANSFIIKPVTFDKLVKTMRAVTEYWLSSVTLPSSVGS